MEEINLLKQKYNDLLQSYTKGQEYVKEKPDDEKAQKKLLKISEEMENILKAIPEKTEQEINKGFVIEDDSKKVTVEIGGETVKEFTIEDDSKKSIVTQTPQTTKAIVVKKESTLQNFNNNWEMAITLSKSSLLPDEFKGHPENTVIALNMAEKMGMDAFTICQNLHIIRGKLSWSGAFCKTLIEQSGKYTDLDFVYFGKEGTDERGCYLEATRTRDGKRIQGNKVTIQLAKDEKWWTTNPKWRTMTDQMLGYRAAAFFARLYCGEMLNGIMTSEENMDISSQRENPVDIL